MADSTSYYPLAAARQAGRLRPDLLLLGGHAPWPVPHPDQDLDGFFAALGDRPLYVVSDREGYCPQSLLDHATFTPAGSLLLVERRTP